MFCALSHPPSEPHTSQQVAHIFTPRMKHLYISNAVLRQCIRFKICIISETGQYVDKCPDGPSFQRMSPFILWLCIPAQAGRHMTQLNTVLFSQPPSTSPWPLNLLSSLSCSLLQMFIWKIYFLLGLKEGSHLKFSFTKQKNILLEGDDSKGK